MLCLETTRQQADDLVLRIRSAVAQPFQIADASVHVGISIGVSDSPDGVGEETLEQADRAGYEAKAGGRALRLGTPGEPGYGFRYSFRGYAGGYGPLR